MSSLPCTLALGILCQRCLHLARLDEFARTHGCPGCGDKMAPEVRTQVETHLRMQERGIQTVADNLGVPLTRNVPPLAPAMQQVDLSAPICPTPDERQTRIAQALAETGPLLDDPRYAYSTWVGTHPPER
jgi:hypothetical protein